MELILIFLLIALVIYLADKYFLNHWTRLGVKQTNVKFFFGNLKTVLLQKECFGVFFKHFYNLTKNDRFFGIYFSYKPALVINDPKMIKDVFIKDFTSFHDRGVYVNEKHDILSGHLFAMEGQKWRDLRVKLSPTFTSGKLKGMFPVFVDCADKLQQYIEKQVRLEREIVDVRDLAARFTTNIIASVAFGVDVDCINEPTHLFREMGRKIFVQNVKNGLRAARALICPKSKLTHKFKQIDDDVEKFFVDLVHQTMEYREKNNIKRHDFLQLLIQLKNEGYKSVDRSVDMEDDDRFEYFKDKSLSGSQKITFEEACAQAFVFYVAGFETSSTATSYCLYELAKNPDIQRKLQEEIDEVLLTDSKTHELSYEKIMSMKYLDACVKEALRKYPPLPFLNREASSDYRLPGTDTVIKKGTAVVIPIFGIQNDPKYYPEPEKFIPERFLDKKNNDEETFLAFGDGPRNCIGMRMGYMSTKIGIVTMLSNFSVGMTKDLPFELGYDSKMIILTPSVQLNLKFAKRSLN